MARTVTVKAGDTLSQIARSAYGSAAFTLKLADYNGITDPNLLRIGEQLELPTMKELTSKHRPATLTGTLQPPHGLEEIIATFGDISTHIRTNGHLRATWESGHLTNAPIPFPISLSWERTRQVQGIYCHKLLAPLVSGLFKAIEQQGLHQHISSYGGCFNYRPKRQSSKLSTHCWGIAIDLNPETNQQGSKGDMHPALVELFKQHGFTWGGNWSGKSKDPMHFQFCTGY